mgnify:CR=1 FL=1
MANPAERRAIFEEAAGVAKFKARKIEASRKLEVFAVDVDGANVQRLTFNDFYDGHCTW